MKILVVDDQAYNRALIVKILTQYGHEVEQGKNGQEACEAIESDSSIDLLVLDVVMPVMDGVEAAKKIKQNIGDRFLPILFITALGKEENLSACLEAGGDDFIPKPITEAVLIAKVNAHRRSLALYRKLENAKKELSYHRGVVDQEHSIVEHIFTQIDSHNDVYCSNIKVYTSPMSMFNGDFVMTAPSPSGGVYGIVGDFTGHGLGAAIGSLPVSEIFSQLVSDQASVSQIAKKINLRLLQLLPDNMFFCASIFEIDRDAKKCILWQGGMNDLLTVKNDNTEISAVQSVHLPLGILSETEFDDSPMIIDLEGCSRFYIYTDGVVEAENSEMEQFGESRLREALLHNPNHAIPSLIETVTEFTRREDFNDDVSVLEFLVSDVVHINKKDNELVCVSDAYRNLESIPWSLDLSLSDSDLKNASVVDQVMAFVSSIKGIELHNANIFTIISELYSNSLEHGVLKLDSDLKNTPDGFQEYYSLRQQRLEDLCGQQIDIRFRYLKGVVAEGEPNSVEIEIQDSGDGFDVDNVLAMVQNDTASHGRGVSLLSKMCHELSYRDGGKTAKAIYQLGTN